MVKRIMLVLLAFGLSPAVDQAPAFAMESPLIEVATSDRQWTGVAVSREGRVFVNYPRWSPDVTVSVGELGPDGSVAPYPDKELNTWQTGEDPSGKLVCVQSVYVDRKDRLWILDPANPLFGGVVEGGAKLLLVDLETNKINRVYPFDSTVAPKTSYLNDVRVDTNTETAYMTDSGMGAIVVLDLKTGNARRLLDDHPSTNAEDIQITINGNPFPIAVHSDGIALDQEEGCLYFQALTGRTLYRIPTNSLRDKSLETDTLANLVERFAKSGVSDGLLFADGGVYLSALEDGSIKHVDSTGEVKTIVTDPRIVWPDSFALGADGSVWFTTSQIHLGPSPSTPYRILKLEAPEVTPKE